MFCSISGNVPESPVVDKKTGHVFERELIFKYVQETGKHPVTGEVLDKEDLLELKNSQAVKPRPSPATSIPGLLSLFHNEWDALMLETHSLRQSLNATRQELSQALYQHDASVRVIARLIRERDEARAALDTAHLQPETANGKRTGTGEPGPAPAKRAKGGITPDIIEAMTKQSAALSKTRKKRQISETLANPNEVAELTLADSYALHKTTQGGIQALDFEASNEDVVYTAGTDHTGQIFDRAANRAVGSLRGHSKKVTDIKVVSKHGVVLTTSADSTARVWKLNAEGGSNADYGCESILKDHKAEVTAATIHPTQDYVITLSLDKTWCFYDLPTATCLQQVTDDSIESGYTAAQIHPDGLILGTGTADSLVRIWEVRQQKNVAKLEHEKGPVKSISFSENGYYLATAAGDGVKLWDLRKLLNFRTLEGTGPATFASFDHSGNYLAVGGAEVQVVGVKQEWATLNTLHGFPKKGVLTGKWGADARRLFVGAADHNLRVFELGGPSPME